LKRASPDLFFMRGVFFIVGPTATGKSEIAAEVAGKLGAEIVSADAFQIYRGLDLLTAKPDPATLARAPHHLVGTVSIFDEMSAAKFRERALIAISEIHLRGKLAMAVGGSGLYIKALTHGLSSAAGSDPKTRAKLSKLNLDQLRRVVRALEICLLSGRPASAQRTHWAGNIPAHGVFVFHDRDELYDRINRRVEAMFDSGVIEEVREACGMSETASKMIGLREIRELLDGKMSILQCVAAIQQATRRYAKRQLTWFRRQTNFQPLNLSLLSHNEAVKEISQLARSYGVAPGND